MLRWKRVEVSGGALLMGAFLFYMDGDGLLLWAFAACVLHELGHLAAIRLLGGRVALLRITCVGAELRLSSRHTLGRGGSLLSALAGPVANLVAAAISAHWTAVLGEGAYLFAGLNLGLCAFNLLPVAQLDGGRVCQMLLSFFCREERAVALVRGLSSALCLLLAACGMLALVMRGNPTLLLTTGWLLLCLTGADNVSSGMPWSSSRKTKRKTEKGLDNIPSTW